MSVEPRSIRLSWTTLSGLLLAGGAAAQASTDPVGGPLGDLPVIFSIDWHGPTISADDAITGADLTEADLLTFTPGGPDFGPLDHVTTAVPGASLGLSRYSICVGHQPGTPCGIEVDALSFGREIPLENDAAFEYRFFFTVDEYARGLPAVPAPSISSEAPVGDISADILIDHGLPPGPLPPQPGTHAIVYDGNGETSATGFASFGIGLIEPNVPGSGLPMAASDPGDNIDALAIGYMPDLGDPIFFSVDEDFVDPIVTLNNSGTAGFEGVRGGDVLVATVGGMANTIYAQAGQLGLDFFGANTDDLDALAIAENGVPGYQRSQVLYDWVPTPSLVDSGPGTDMLLFSVRRGSAVIGETDSIQGIPIQEGDILVPPVMGGLSPFPGIYIAAENLGMATRRGGGMEADDANGMSPG